MLKFPRSIRFESRRATFKRGGSTIYHSAPSMLETFMFAPPETKASLLLSISTLKDTIVVIVHFPLSIISGRDQFQRSKSIAKYKARYFKKSILSCAQEIACERCRPRML